ncbi:hypothetical protein AMECASPLE_006741 [Ameca splendens]|uniref:Secreted protein n=1 Tax=Ameca splendens TaxID=208324 RepID=A0ABV0XCL4_9TELE
MPFCHLLATRFSSGCCSERSDFQRLSWNVLSPRQKKTTCLDPSCHYYIFVSELFAAKAGSFLPSRGV